VLLALSVCWPPALGAEPWLTPGNVRLRHDLQLLADSDPFSGPTLSWPIGW